MPPFNLEYNMGATERGILAGMGTPDKSYSAVSDVF
jgi:hypothetical protein